MPAKVSLSVSSGTGLDARTALVSTPPGYRLEANGIDCDIGRFVIEKNGGVLAAAAAHFETASRHFAAALAEWRGPVLEDLRDFGFVDPFATALTADELYVLTARAEAEIVCGRWYAVIAELQGLIIGHPYHEPLWAQLITAYYLSDALDAYGRLKSHPGRGPRD
jgi:SARP family transcriptional regulator, regulator of embCAB operon